MCKDCGCQEHNKFAFSNLKKTEHGHTHHTHAHSHVHAHSKFNDSIDFQSLKQEVELQHNILSENDYHASQNREWFQKNKILVFNFISSPGSGKTLLLEKTISLLKDKLKLSIIVGDQETDLDAKRLLKVGGGEVKQINTFSSCHLDAHQIAHEIEEFVTESNDVLFIENVGNLVCPTAFDLGESIRVALLSTPEGEDKPLKYPVLFHTAQVIVISKYDLAEVVDFNEQYAIECIRKINPYAPIFKVSAKNGEGMGEWIQLIIENYEKINNSNSKNKKNAIENGHLQKINL